MRKRKNWWKNVETLWTHRTFFIDNKFGHRLYRQNQSIIKYNVHRNLSYRPKLAELLITSLTPPRVRKYKKNTTKNLTFAWTSEMGESYAQETLTLSIVLDYSEHEVSESSIRLKKEWKLTEKTQKQVYFNDPWSVPDGSAFFSTFFLIKK